MSQTPASRPTHFNDDGEARMVDVTDKSPTVREAIASARITMSEPAARAIQDRSSQKGDVLGVARIAGIGAAKWTSTLIPLCHAIPIEGVEIAFEWQKTPEIGADPTLLCTATVRTTYKTGVEMEALTAASIAALTVYDMLKAIDKSMVVRETRLESKTGGKSGGFSRNEIPADNT